VFGDTKAGYMVVVVILAEVIAPRMTVESPAKIKGLLKRLLVELDQYGLPALRARAACLHVFPSEADGVLASLASALTGGKKGELGDTFAGILTVLRNESLRPDPRVQALLADVAQQVKWRREVGLTNALHTMRTVVGEVPELLSDVLRSDVLAGLSELLHETAPLAKEPFADIADRLSHREDAAALAYALYRDYSQRGTSIPNAIQGWQSICADPEEFAEVRNRWEE